RVHEQAYLLEAFSEFMLIFRDWERTVSDQLLEPYKLNHIFNDLPSKALDQPAFPKDAFVAIALGNVSTVLNNLQAKGTPLFMQCAQGGIAWLDNKKDCPTKTA